MKRLLLLIVVAVIAVGGYFLLGKQNRLEPISASAETLPRYTLLTRCAGLHRGIYAEMKAMGRSSIERGAPKVFAQLMTVAAHAEKGVKITVLQENYEPEIVADIDGYQTQYAPHIGAFLLKEDNASAALVKADAGHCRDARNMQ